VFVHIPKCAGTSIERFLGHFDELKPGVQDHRTVTDMEPLSAGRVLAAAGDGDNRASLLRRSKLLAKGTRGLGQADWDAYFKFTFVRNPWARVFSWYENVLRSETHQQRFGVAPDCSLVDFLTDHGDQWALRSQLFWILDSNGENPLDFVGRFENLADDFAHVCERLGITERSLPNLVAGSGRRYTDHYDDATRAIIADRYRDEIDYFNYTFDDG
jgi:hypothetical protein